MHWLEVHLRQTPIIKAPRGQQTSWKANAKNLRLDDPSGPHVRDLHLCPGENIQKLGRLTLLTSSKILRTARSQLKESQQGLYVLLGSVQKGSPPHAQSAQHSASWNKNYR